MNLQEGRGRRRPAPEINGQPLPRRTRRRTLEDPCDLCKLMFSSKGLEHLNSLAGLRHHTRASCVASQDEGCKICKFIYLAVCKDPERDWGENDHLIFHNFLPQPSINNPSLYSLQCTIEGGLADSVITINTFAREGLHSPSYRQSNQVTNSS
jgi:hypothetical protein